MGGMFGPSHHRQGNGPDWGWTWTPPAVWQFVWGWTRKLYSLVENWVLAIGFRGHAGAGDFGSDVSIYDVGQVVKSVKVTSGKTGPEARGWSAGAQWGEKRMVIVGGLTGDDTNPVRWQYSTVQIEGCLGWGTDGLELICFLPQQWPHLEVALSVRLFIMHIICNQRIPATFYNIIGGSK